MIKRILSLMPLSATCAAIVHGQALCLVITSSGDVLPVAGAVGVIPEAIENGRLTEVHDYQATVLKRSVSYADGYIKFEDFRVDPVFDENGSPDDKNFSLKGALTSDRTLLNNYLYFVFEADPGNPPSIVIAEAPDLTAGVRTTLRLNVPQDPTLRLQERNYTVHFFSGIREHVTSLMPEADQKVAETLTDAEILEKTANRALGTILKIRPDHPASIPSSVEGTAMVQARVGPDGLVLQTSVVSATNPEFGANAMDAVKHWVFAPAIKNHEYVEALVDVPVKFAKPKPKAAAPAAAPAAPAAAPAEPAKS
jgi:TonB family protein